ncbi:hypothetical protein EDC04DRAFT_2610696 [Pisolithus marmoratus]|nr:hypothetical protein EDC04DRAFT_2610696 [Pisolithus marmoratus]
MACRQAFLLEAFSGMPSMCLPSFILELVVSLKGIAKENDVDHAAGADKWDLEKLKSQKCKASSSSEGITSKCQQKSEGDHAGLAPTYKDVGAKESTDGLAVQLARCRTVTVMPDQDQMPSSVHNTITGPSNESSVDLIPGREDSRMTFMLMWTSWQCQAGYTTLQKMRMLVTIHPSPNQFPLCTIPY